MSRATLKVSHDAAALLSRAKLDISVDVDQQVTTDQAIRYLVAYWRLTRPQRHKFIIGPDGIPYGPFDVPAKPA